MGAGASAARRECGKEIFDGKFDSKLVVFDAFVGCIARVGLSRVEL